MGITKKVCLYNFNLTNTHAMLVDVVPDYRKILLVVPKGFGHHENYRNAAG